MSKYHPSTRQRDGSCVLRADDARECRRARRADRNASAPGASAPPPAASSPHCSGVRCSGMPIAGRQRALARRAGRSRAPTPRARRTARYRPCRRSAVRRAPWNMPRSPACVEPDGRSKRTPPGSSTTSLGVISRTVSGNPGAVTHVAVRGGETLEQCRGADRSDDLDRRGPRRQECRTSTRRSASEGRRDDRCGSA